MKTREEILSEIKEAVCCVRSANKLYCNDEISRDGHHKIIAEETAKIVVLLWVLGHSQYTCSELYEKSEVLEEALALLDNANTIHSHV